MGYLGLGNLTVEISQDSESLGGTSFKLYNVFTFCLLVRSVGKCSRAPETENVSQLT